MPPVPLLCRIGFHDWQILYDDEGQPYHECVRCRKVKGNAGRTENPSNNDRTGGTAGFL